MDQILQSQFIIKPRSDAELKAVIKRFEAKWQQRRKAHPFAGLAV
jgi:hypothetical protein